MNSPLSNFKMTTLLALNLKIIFFILIKNIFKLLVPKATGDERCGAEVAAPKSPIPFQN